jgi:glycosyltransferase involved in cell wall biosynthesis
MTKKKVLFEAGPMLDGRKTGVGYYVSQMIGSLNNAHSNELDIVGYYFNFLNRRDNLTSQYKHIRFRRISFIPGKVLSICRRLGFQPFLELFVRERADAVIFTNYVSLPQLRKKITVLVVYDLGFLDVPEFTQSQNLKYLLKFCPPSILKADIIITISEFTKERLEYYFPNLKANIIVTHIPPAEVLLKPTELSDNLSKKGINKKSYILYLGTIEPRKNLETLIAAYSKLRPELKSKYSLVLAGGKGWKDKAIIDAISKEREKGANIIETGYISEDEKNALYSNASCFVLPSHYEGFGMPLLEAMKYDLPTLASDIPVFREIAGGASLFFNKNSSQDLAEKISFILTDQKLKKKLSSKAKNHLNNFSWQDNTSKIFETLRSIDCG